MADIKISALPAATTPLAGTEVLPIVQSGVTAKVAVSNLTAGRSVSATAVAITGSTSGTATIVTPAVAGTPTITLPIVTGTLATLAGTETLTNKTLTSPTLTTPALGTPASADFTTIAATQAQQETGTAVTAPVTPGRQQFHPSAAKFWVVADPAGSITASYNVASISDGGVGILGVTIDTDFSSANWTGAAQVQENSNATACKFSSTVAAGSCEVRTYVTTSGTLTDPNRFFVQGFGDQ
jgi:hypothetical protein